MKKKVFYLSLSLASALVTPNLFASSNEHPLEDIENVKPQRHKILLHDGSHAKVVLNHRASTAADQAKLMRDHAKVKKQRLQEKVALAVQSGQSDLTDLRDRLNNHQKEQARLKQQHKAIRMHDEGRASTGKSTTKARKVAKYGLTLDPLSGGEKRQDRLAALKVGASASSSTTASSIDLTKGQKILDQGQLGSCTAHGTTACLKQAGLKEDPARLFIYLNARVNMGADEGNPDKYVQQDSGATIANAAIGATHYGGLVPESKWPYSDSTKKKVIIGTLPPFMQQPKPECYHAGTDLANKVQLSFAKVDPSIEGIIERLQKGRYVVFGMTLHNSFMGVGKNGIVPLPGGTSDAIAGGHCMAIGGYFPNMNASGIDYFKVQNSWSASWGDHGFCYIPASMLNTQDTLSDMWYVSGGLSTDHS